MGFAYDREKNDKLESNDSEKTYEEDVYDTLHEIENSNKDLTNKRDVIIEYEYDKQYQICFPASGDVHYGNFHIL